MLGAFGDVRVDALDVGGDAGIARFATLDAACVLALPLDPLALTGLHLTLVRALVDALEVRKEARPTRRGRLDAPRQAPDAFEWACARVDSSGGSMLMPLGASSRDTKAHGRVEPNAVLLPQGVPADAIADALPMSDA